MSRGSVLPIHFWCRLRIRPCDWQFYASLGEKGPEKVPLKFGLVPLESIKLGTGKKTCTSLRSFEFLLCNIFQ